MNFDHFINQKNIERYQRLINIAAKEPHRPVMLRLLTEELEKSKQLARNQEAAR